MTLTKPVTNKLVPVLLLVILFFSCVNNGSKNNNEHKEEKEKPAIGTIVESVLCRTNPQHTYAYYLPSYYDANKSFPIVIAFDAHARGSMVISKFKEAAEQYGYIIVCSNNAKNGLKDINGVINSLWDDVLARFSVDRKRIYTAGFSGGARIAASVAIYKGGVKGVIGCAGGMPSVGQELTQKFVFLGIVGLNDFNYHEMLTLDKALNEQGFVSQLLTFNGKHEWPPSEMLSKALQWLDLMAMKQEVIPVNDNLVRNYTTSYADTINQLIRDGKSYEAYLLYNILLEDLKGLYDISDYEKSYKELLKNPQVTKGIKAQEIEKVKELNQQETLLNYFKNNSFAQIKNKIKSLQNSSNHVSKRLLAFVGMLSYIYTEGTVNSQNNAAYKGFMEIYELVEPKNPDKEFFKACQATMDNQPDKAMQYLQKAIEYGYYDADRLNEIGYFEQLRTLPEFDLLIQKARENSKK